MTYIPPPWIIVSLHKLSDDKLCQKEMVKLLEISRTSNNDNLFVDIVDMLKFIDALYLSEQAVVFFCCLVKMHKSYIYKTCPDIHLNIIMLDFFERWFTVIDKSDTSLVEYYNMVVDHKFDHLKPYKESN